MFTTKAWNCLIEPFNILEYRTSITLTVRVEGVMGFPETIYIYVPHIHHTHTTHCTHTPHTAQNHTHHTPYLTKKLLYLL